MSARIDVNGDGYEQVRTDDGSCLQHHRVLMYAWGHLDSVFFAADAREIHHEESVEWFNFETDMRALTPAEHREEDPGRARIRAPWDDMEIQQ